MGPTMEKQHSTNRRAWRTTEGEMIRCIDVRSVPVIGVPDRHPSHTSLNLLHINRPFATTVTPQVSPVQRSL